MKKRLLSLAIAACMTFAMITGCGSAPEKTPETQAQQAESQGENAPESQATTSEGHKVGFVTFGLGGDFFQMLADTFVEVMTENGWEASYADGQFDPGAQISACENYIADGVDVLVCWSVAPGAMGAITDACAAKGIKFVSFVQQTEQYDALMVSDDAKTAEYAVKMAAKWIDETYADAEDHSVPVAALTVRLSDSNVAQADMMLKIEEYSTKAKFAKEIELEAEDAATGQAAAENLYATNPEIKVFITPQGGLANGVNNFYTAISSPVTDYSDMGIFAINGDNAMAESIKASVEGKSPLRGTVMTGSVRDTAEEMYYVCAGLMDGSLPTGHVQEAGVLFVIGETVDEYLETGKVTSVTKEDYE